MDNEPQDLTFETDEDVTIVRMGGKILDPLYIDKVSGQLNELAERSDAPKIVLDLEEVSHLSSSALGMLTTLQQIVRERGGQLRLCNIQPPIFTVFKITRLNEVLGIHNSREEAVKSLR